MKLRRPAAQPNRRRKPIVRPTSSGGATAAVRGYKGCYAEEGEAEGARLGNPGILHLRAIHSEQNGAVGEQPIMFSVD
jgi:hypothetical protein